MDSQTNLNELIKERDALLNKYKDVSFPSKEEMEDYVKKNQSELTRLKELNKEIQDMQWNLMSKKEQQEYLEQQKKLKEKYSND